MKFTILGSTGFIGSNLVKYLEEEGVECKCPSKNYDFNKEEDLGHLIYCIGLTSDFRSKPFETIEAHVCELKKVLMNTSYSSFLYLSSTRVYNGSQSGEESSKLVVDPNDFSDLYNISKLMGESICLSIPDDKVRVVRLSNVIGYDFSSGNFLFSLIKEAVDNQEINLKQSPNIGRDYVTLDSVIKMIQKIALKGKDRLYNIASGVNTSNRDIVEEIVKFTDSSVAFCKEKESLTFPIINNDKIKNEFSYQPQLILEEIEKLINAYKNSNDTN